VRTEVSANGAWVVVVSGDVDLNTAPAVEDAVRAVPADARDVRVDMTDVTFVDSSGVSALMRLHFRFPGRVTLVRPPAQVTQVLEMTHTAELFEVEH
jgi:anti-sigma B factor antagonist